MQGKVEICGVNTAKLKTLSPAQMDELLLKAKTGDENARQALIEGNLRLVLSVIQRFDKRGESPDDLFQVGCIGLMKAIANFDPDKQVRFSTYGVPMIAGEVRRYLRDNSPIRVSRSIRDVAYRVLQCKEQLLSTMSREPTLEEIANKVDEKIDAIRLQYVDDAFGEAQQAGEGIFDLIEKFKEHPEVGVPLYGPLINTVTRGARLKNSFSAHR